MRFLTFTLQKQNNVFLKFVSSSFNVNLNYGNLFLLHLTACLLIFVSFLSLHIRKSDLSINIRNLGFVTKYFKSHKSNWFVIQHHSQLEKK